jgi:hypothetical protein
VWAANAESEDAPTLRAVLLVAMVPIFIAGLAAPPCLWRRGDAVRDHLRRRSPVVPGALRRRLAPRERGVQCDRRLRLHGRGRHGAARRLVALCLARCARWKAHESAAGKRSRERTGRPRLPRLLH